MAFALLSSSPNRPRPALFQPHYSFQATTVREMQVWMGKKQRREGVETGLERFGAVYRQRARGEDIHSGRV